MISKTTVEAEVTSSDSARSGQTDVVVVWANDEMGNDVDVVDVVVDEVVRTVSNDGVVDNDGLVKDDRVVDVKMSKFCKKTKIVLT